MAVSDLQSLATATDSGRRGCDFSELKCSSVSKTYRSSSHVQMVEAGHHYHNDAGCDEEEVVGDSDDGYDSDATLDFDDEAKLSPVLRNAPPLQRFTRDYERVVLRSLSQGRVVTYSCVCSQGEKSQECVFNIESKAVGSGDSNEVEQSDDEWLVDEETETHSFGPSRRNGTFSDWKVVNATKRSVSPLEFSEVKGEFANSSEESGDFDCLK